MIRIQIATSRSLDSGYIHETSTNGPTAAAEEEEEAAAAEEEAPVYDNDNDDGEIRAPETETMIARTIFNKRRNKSNSPRRPFHNSGGMSVGGSRSSKHEYNSNSNNNNNNNNDDDYSALPDMIESPSGSMGSSGEFRTRVEDEAERHQRDEEKPQPLSPPQIYSSSSRMQDRFDAALRARRFSPPETTITTAPSQASSSSRTSRTRRRRNGNRAIGEPTDSSILAGASLIRRQLSGDGDGDAERDPWWPGRDLAAKKQRMRNLHRGGGILDELDDHRGRVPGDERGGDHRGGDDVPGVTRNRERVRAILVAGDAYFDERAAASGRATEAPKGAVLAAREAVSPKDAPTKPTPCGGMVQRLSELDNSTFASSSESGGYLPGSLLSGLGCGALSIPVVDACGSLRPLQQREPEPRRLPSVPPAAMSPDEELETKTLDFLANLHAREEDLDFLLRTADVDVDVDRDLAADADVPRNSSSCHATIDSGETTRVLPRGSRSFGDDDATAHRPSWEQQQRQQRRLPGDGLESSSHVTEASTPFEKLVSARSPLHDRLMRDPGYVHALEVGDPVAVAVQPARPVPGPLVGRVRADRSAPRVLPQGPAQALPVGVRRPAPPPGRSAAAPGDREPGVLGTDPPAPGGLDAVTGLPSEDVAVGAFHPNARGVRTTPDLDPLLEGCRDVWIAHRKRVPDKRVTIHDDVDDDDDDDEDDPTRTNTTTALGSLLRHRNGGTASESPLGGSASKRTVDNRNLRSVFGSKPPVATVFCEEREVFECLQRRAVPAAATSVALLRRYLGATESAVVLRAAGGGAG
eukprot:CAMPEP_0197177014 /NCGR_PEP_ID=MMETSP1423-20130617/2766_1 /TAXON_ID=476441 /ORGANISM="Pseudo-nitzschia heimii, Strain UNC1101" /LENGTH=808 /DNA_ID=CAMNT_0042626489 /DNA_START=82 /DNA_END=2508 /DNA_ORIENTATION=-